MFAIDGPWTFDDGIELSNGELSAVEGIAVGVRRDLQRSVLDCWERELSGRVDLSAQPETPETASRADSDQLLDLWEQTYPSRVVDLAADPGDGALAASTPETVLARALREADTTAMLLRRWEEQYPLRGH